MIAVISMWILIILSVFSISVGSQARFEVDSSRHHLNKKKTYQLAYSGLTLATGLIDRDGTPKLDTAFDAWVASTGAGSFEKLPLGSGWVSIGYERLNPVNDRFETVYGIEDEDSKININFAPLNVLMALPGVDESIADCILDWRDADPHTRRHGAESTDYKNSGQPYTCADGFFENVDELLMVKGIDADLLASLKPFVTVYGDSAVNVWTAPPEVLSAIGIPAVLVGKIIRFREDSDAVSGFTVNNKMVETFVARLGDSQPLAHSEKVVLRSFFSGGWLKFQTGVFRIRSQGVVPVSESHKGESRTVHSIIEVVYKRGLGTTSRSNRFAYWREP